MLEHNVCDAELVCGLKRNLCFHNCLKLRDNVRQHEQQSSFIDILLGGERDKSSLKSYSINSINSFPFSIGSADGDRRARQPLSRIYLPNFILSLVVQSSERLFF